MYKVSIIIPIYNVEKYLKECIDSAVNQTLKDVEIILVDDGSTDNSGRICDEYAKKDNRIKVIHQTNGGLGKAYNAGLKNSTAPYIGFLESDDYAETDMFESLYKTAAENDADVVKGDWFYYSTTPQISNIYQDSFKNFPTNTIINSRQYPLITNIKPTIWSAIYKREFLNRYDINFLETPGASYQDASFAFKAACAAEKFILVPKAFIHYRQDNEFASVKSKGKVYAVCDEYNEIDKFLDKFQEIKEYIEPYKWLMQFHGYNWNLKRIDNIYKKEFAQVYREHFLELAQKPQIMETFLDNLPEIQKQDFQVLLKDADSFVTVKNLRAKNRQLYEQNKDLKNKNAELTQKIEKLSIFKFNLFGIKFSHKRKNVL